MDNVMLPALWEKFKDPHISAQSVGHNDMESGVEDLDWPVQSSDFNPTENLWDEFKRKADE